VQEGSPTTAGGNTLIHILKIEQRGGRQSERWGTGGNACTNETARKIVFDEER
jgi:hypothetical protein